MSFVCKRENSCLGKEKPHGRDADPCQIAKRSAAARSSPKVLRAARNIERAWHAEESMLGNNAKAEFERIPG